MKTVLQSPQAMGGGLGATALLTAFVLRVLSPSFTIQGDGWNALALAGAAVFLGFVGWFGAKHPEIYTGIASLDSGNSPSKPPAAFREDASNGEPKGSANDGG